MLSLNPLRIAAVPGITLDVVVRGQLGAKELSQESPQNVLPRTSHETISTSPVALVNSTTNAAPARRNPVGGLVEEATQNNITSITHQPYHHAEDRKRF